MPRIPAPVSDGQPSAAASNPSATRAIYDATYAWSDPNTQASVAFFAYAARMSDAIFGLKVLDSRICNEPDSPNKPTRLAVVRTCIALATAERTRLLDEFVSKWQPGSMDEYFDRRQGK